MNSDILKSKPNGKLNGKLITKLSTNINSNINTNISGKKSTVILTGMLIFLTTACSNASPTSQIQVKTNQQPTESELMIPQAESTSMDASLPNKKILDGLKFTYEEEKLASDIYATLYDTWQIQAFNNIGRTEIRHQRAVADLLDRYAIEVDERLPVGQFADPHLQQAYDELIAKGMQSEQDALEVGAYVEELDIQDLNRLLTLDNPEDIRQTYEWLSMGSRNHLRAFVRNMENRDIAYQPQLLDTEAYLAIINSDHERGMGGGIGQGKRHGGGGQHQRGGHGFGS